MKNDFLINISRFIILVLVQVLILNHINFLGYINPYLYILFVILLPIGLEQWKTLFFSFLIGLCIDVFEDTGGVYAASCLVIAYFRPLLLRFAYGLSYDYQTLKFYKTPLKERFVYVALMVVLHNLVLFSLLFFDVSHLVLILKNILFSSIFTILLILIVTSLFQKSKR